MGAWPRFGALRILLGFCAAAACFVLADEWLIVPTDHHQTVREALPSLFIALVGVGVAYLTLDFWRRIGAPAPTKRRWPHGLCSACGYSRDGLAPAAPCPECGKVPAV